MLKSTTVFVFILLAAAVTGIYSLASTNSLPMTAKVESSPSTPINEQYQAYSAQALASTAEDRRVLFFFSNWCATCRSANGSFTQNIAQVPDDVQIIRVNYGDGETNQEEKDLAQKYNVAYRHTFVQIDAQGNKVTEWNGGQTEELLAKIK